MRSLPAIALAALTTTACVVHVETTPLGARGGLVVGQIDNEVDEFKRAVAIRYTPR